MVGLRTLRVLGPPYGSPAHHERHLRDALTQVSDRIHSNLVIRDLFQFLLVPDTGAEVGTWAAFADDDHFLAEQRRLNRLDGQLLSAVASSPDGHHAGDFVAESESILAEDHQSFQEGLAE